MKSKRFRSNLEISSNLWGTLPPVAVQRLEDLSRMYLLSIAAGDLLYHEGKWYVTHSGLLGIARRKRCVGIQVRHAVEFCNPEASRWAFKATVYKSPKCRGFVGYGDADPSNVSPLVHGAEMRVAETRAVNRALRKAYGIGTEHLLLLAPGSPGCRTWGVSQSLLMLNGDFPNETAPVFHAGVWVYLRGREDPPWARQRLRHGVLMTLFTVGQAC